MYKVRANGTQEGNTINLGTDVRTLASFNNEVPIVEGYNWINNPNEFELTLDDLNMLALHGQDGDVIIGQTSSVAYNIVGKRWVGPADFRLQPCKGYIFFTMSDNHQNINLLFSGRPSSLLTSMINSEARQHTSRLPWTLKNRGYADNMPMMVRIEGLDQPENYVIGAFVNEECRGVGEVVTRDVMLVNVAGKYGDKVTLRLYNRLTDEELAVNQQMNYTSMLGSLSSPLRLTASVDLGVNHNLNANFSVDKDAVIYSVSGQRLSAPGRGINIIRTTEGSRRILKTIKK